MRDLYYKSVLQNQPVVSLVVCNATIQAAALHQSWNKLSVKRERAHSESTIALRINTLACMFNAVALTTPSLLVSSS